MRLICLVLLCLLISQPVRSDEIRPVYLQLTQQTKTVIQVLWRVPVRTGNQPLALQVRFEDSARAISEPVEGVTEGYYSRQWTLQRPQGVEGLQLWVEGLAQSSAEVLLRIEYLQGGSHTDRLLPTTTTYRVPPTASDKQTALTYLLLGMEHILLGFDHLLFVAALMMLVQGWRNLLLAVTAFTLSHSITLALSVFEVIALPGPPLEACIALSIIFVAREILMRQKNQTSLSQRKPWLLAWVFGLLHGMGFAAALADIGLPQEAVALALFMFNLGVELGQLLFVSVLLICFYGLRRMIGYYTDASFRLSAYTIGSLAAFWLIERIAIF